MNIFVALMNDAILTQFFVALINDAILEKACKFSLVKQHVYVYF